MAKKKLKSGQYEKPTQDLVRAMMELPGIRLMQSTTWNKTHVGIFFKVDEGDHRGLFVLARAADRRYWRYGHRWSITVDVCDLPETVDAVTFLLKSKSKGDKAIEQMADLIHNLEYTRRHPAFLKGYGIEELALPPFKRGDVVYYTGCRKHRVKAGEYVVAHTGGQKKFDDDVTIVIDDENHLEVWPGHLRFIRKKKRKRK